MNLVLCDLAITYDQPPASSTVLPPQGPQVLYDNMGELAEIFCLTDGDMKNVAHEMINHFIEGTGTNYQSDTLTQKVLGHSATQTFISASQWYLSYTNQFGSWYVLQHYTGCEAQHRPFISYMKISSDFSGSLS